LSAFFAIAILLFAYAVTALATRARKILEGDWPRAIRFLRDASVERQGHRWLKLDRELRNVIELRLVEMDQETWMKKLSEARVLGSKVNVGVSWKVPSILERLRKKRAANQVLQYRGLRAAVRNLAHILTLQDADENPELNVMHQDMAQLIDYAVE